ncbi:DUF2510 domain-containing protein [Cellulomonas sp. ICMP 17802]|uniref:DUF2510 domain-containing protein n=1 Tax=Cellulomonas sp. ICMP 17802 TaxID=3239199 RepID=UPI00351BD2FF
MTATPPPGWYDDRATPGVVRWFDGAGWTPHVAPVMVAPPPATGDGTTPGDPLHWIVPVGRSWQSVAAGYVGLCALFIWALGPVAVWLGVLGLQRARSGGHGSGRAVFAIIAGVLGSVAGVAFLVNQL